MAKKLNVLLGADISTTCTAITALDYDTGNILKIYYTIMNNKKKFPHFWSKVQHMENLIDSEHETNWNVVGIAIEESAKRFSPGFSSAGTIITLAKFNGILCYLFYKKYNKVPMEINVRTARKVLNIKIDTKDKSQTTKQKVLNEVLNTYPTFPLVLRTVKGKTKPVKINEDRIDSWIMAESARKLYPKL